MWETAAPPAESGGAAAFPGRREFSTGHAQHAVPVRHFVRHSDQAALRIAEAVKR
ncbi:hypothetical protein ACFWAA_18120 [Streptomyces sp. NPDC059922]|uniref:hypothetical protein n=1 Tax=Streptomyces sp. NPDC059922 TaxID=3347005 RepID=UPI0036544FEC